MNIVTKAETKILFLNTEYEIYARTVHKNKAKRKIKRNTVTGKVQRLQYLSAVCVLLTKK